MPSKQESRGLFLLACLLFVFFLSLSLCLNMCGSQESGDEFSIFGIVAGFGLRDMNLCDRIN